MAPPYKKELAIENAELLEEVQVFVRLDGEPGCELHAQRQVDGEGVLTDPWGADQNFHVRPHDFEFVDVDRDGCLDLFMGLCTGYAVFRQTNCAPATAVAGATFAPTTSVSIE